MKCSFKKYFILLTLLFTSITHADNNKLPSNWSSHVYGVTVKEADLGRYLGQNQIEGDVFHVFWNEVTDMKGVPLFCFYPVHAEKYYVGSVYCTGIKLKD